MPNELSHQPIKVPRADRSVLAIPCLKAAPRACDANRQLFATVNCSLNGKSLSALRQETRCDAVAAARSFTSALIGEDVPVPNCGSLVVSGHQPELYHVGVWSKTFALAGVARNSGATAINLIIDNDTMNGTSIRVPTGNRQHLKVERVPFDGPHPTQPWEEVLIRDRDVLEQFGQRIRSTMRSNWGFEPISASAWTSAIRSAGVSNRLCDSLSALRATIEHQWGVPNLELPMSQLCETRSFFWFTAHLLERLPELHAVYNQTLAEYRRTHRLRNRMQPVPDLDVVDDWLESPFWIWRQGDTQRGRLFVRRSGRTLELRGENDVVARIPVTDGGSLEKSVDILSQLRAKDLRLRTRALTTTLFARACLADLFVHGIGGAKYDAMTDQMFQRLFQINAPQFLTVSATLLLPLGGQFEVTESDLRHARQQLRDLKYNPDRYMTADADVQELIRQKHQLIDVASASRKSGRLRGRLTWQQHQAMEQLRQQLSLHAGQIRTKLESEKSVLEAQLATNRLMNDREFSFVLFPEDRLREFLIPLFTTTF